MKTGAMQFKQKCRLDFFISISYLNSTFGAVVAAASAAKGILGVLEQYAYALETLDKYDHQKLTIETGFEKEKIHNFK